MLFVLLPEMVKIGIILMCTQYFMDWKYFSDCTRIPLKGKMLSLRNISLTVCCAEVQIVTNQYVSKYLIFYLL